jgi:hypothetical protein
MQVKTIYYSDGAYKIEFHEKEKVARARGPMTEPSGWVGFAHEFWVDSIEEAEELLTARLAGRGVTPAKGTQF